MRHTLVVVPIALAMAVAAVTAFAAQTPGAGQAPAGQSAPPAVELKAGDRAPDFQLPGTDGKTYSLAGLKGRTVVLAWFPKAFTGG